MTTCRPGTRDRLLLGRRADQHDAARLGLGVEPVRRLRRRRSRRTRSRRAERQPANSARPRHASITASASSTSPRPSSHAPSRRADAAEVEAHAAPSRAQAGARDRLHDLVVERAAALRMRMADDGQAERRARGRVDRAFDAPGRPGDPSRGRFAGSYAVGAQRPTSGGSSSRSTTLPPFRCESTISSMSLLST